MGLSTFSKMLDNASSSLLSAACGCHTGRRRKNNEDNFFFAGRYMASSNQGLDSILEKSFSLKKERFFAVFDGMGGGEYGEIAAYTAAKAAEEYLQAEEKNRPLSFGLNEKKENLEILCRQMNDRIFREASRLDVEMMGSTLAGLYFSKELVWIVNVGDSRCYLLRDRVLRQISKDQTDEAYMKENGISNRKPYLTQYLGMDPEEIRLQPYVDLLQWEREDRFLLCSDGVTDMLPFSLLEEILQQKNNPEACVRAILKAALKAGGRDNITAMVVDAKR